MSMMRRAFWCKVISLHANLGIFVDIYLLIGLAKCASIDGNNAIPPKVY